MSYSEYELDRSVITPWLNGFWGRKWQAAWASIRDAYVDQARAAVECGLIAECPPDALEKHAQASQFFRGFFEDADSFRARLLQRWDYHVWRGKRKGIVDAVSWAIAGKLKILPEQCNVSVVENWEWTRATLTGVSSSSNRPYWIVIRQPHPFGTTGWHWGDGTVWGEKRWGTSNGDGDIIELIQRVALHQKPPHAQLVEIIVILTGDIVPTTGEPLGSSEVLYWRVQ